MATGPRYAVEFAPSASKQLAAVPAKFRAQIARKIERLRDDPFPQGVVPIKGEPGVYRVVSGNYRILYEVRDDRLIIYVLKVGDRKDVYRGL